MRLALKYNFIPQARLLALGTPVPHYRFTTEGMSLERAAKPKEPREQPGVVDVIRRHDNARGGGWYMHIADQDTNTLTTVTVIRSR